MLRSDPRKNGDILTFRQRPPDVYARHPFVHVRELLGFSPVTTIDDWINKQIKGRTRNLTRLAMDRLDVRVQAFDDEFVTGMTRYI